MKVFVIVALPIVDMRMFGPSDTGSISVPYWPDPARERKEFVRELGHLRARNRRGIAPWIGEANYVDARQGIRFTSLAQMSALRPRYRRFFSSGTIGRLEVGFVVKAESRATDVRALLKQAATARVSLRRERTVSLSRERTDYPLIEFGDCFADHLLRATTKTRYLPEVSKWWIRSGAPIVVAELSAEEARRLSGAKYGASFSTSSTTLRIHQSWSDIDNQRLSAWLMIHDEAAPTGTLRAMRIHALRCHAEFEGFRNVLRQCARKQLDPNASEELRSYLDQQSTFFLKKSFGSLPVNELVVEILDAWDKAYEEEIRAISQISFSLKKGLAGKLQDVAEEMKGAARPDQTEAVIHVELGGTNNHVEIIGRKDDIQVTHDNSVHVAGNAASIVAGSSNTVSTGDIQQTVVDTPEVTSILDELTRSVAELRKSIPDESSDEGEEIVNGIRTELEKPEPDKSRLERSISRLTKWAQVAGDIGEPVLKLVGRLGKALIL